MRSIALLIATAAITGGARYLPGTARPEAPVVRAADTVYVKAAPIDYDELARRVAIRLGNQTHASLLCLQLRAHRSTCVAAAADDKLA